MNAGQGENGLGGRHPNKKQENHGPLRFQQRDSQDAMRGQKNDQRQEESRHKAGGPSQIGEAFVLRIIPDRRERGFLPGLVNDVSAIQKDGGLEYSVGDEMEDGQGKGA